MISGPGQPSRFGSGFTNLARPAAAGRGQVFKLPASPGQAWPGLTHHDKMIFHCLTARALSESGFTGNRLGRRGAAARPGFTCASLESGFTPRRL